MMGKPYVRSVSPDTGEVDTKQKDEERIFKMKKKIIISLILAMCCIIASIPASAGEAATCPPHKSFIHLCGGYAGLEDASHYFVNAAGNTIRCGAQEIRFWTRSYCGICYEEVNTSPRRTHKHGEQSHVCDETLNNNYCPIT